MWKTLVCTISMEKIYQAHRPCQSSNTTRSSGTRDDNSCRPLVYHWPHCFSNTILVSWPYIVADEAGCSAWRSSGPDRAVGNGGCGASARASEIPGSNVKLPRIEPRMPGLPELDPRVPCIWGSILGGGVTSILRFRKIYTRNTGATACTADSAIRAYVPWSGTYT